MISAVVQLPLWPVVHLRDASTLTLRKHVQRMGRAAHKYRRSESEEGHKGRLFTLGTGLLQPVFILQPTPKDAY